MNDIANLALPPAVAAVIAFCLTPPIGRVAFRIGAMDIPDGRKVHTIPVPRLGGLAVVISIAVVWTIGGSLLQEWHLPPEIVTGMGLGVLPILGVSLVDDIRGVRARTKFAYHLTGAGIAAASGISLGSDVHLLGQSIHIGWLSLPLSVLWMVGVTNAFNIIDGLDGLSAGLALIAATSMAAVFAMVDQPEMTAAALVLAGALAGFLPYNLHPARLFLGDTGATAIGFCLAVFALEGGSTLSSGFAVLIPVFMMGLPIADTLIAIARRLIFRLGNRAGGLFVADRDHIHHRLMALGLSHAKAVLILYGTGITFAVAAIISIFLTARQAAMFVVALTFAGFVGMHRLGYDEFAFLRRGTILSAYERPVVKRAMFAVFADIALIAAAAYVAIGLKLDVWNPIAARSAVFDLAGTVAPLTVLIFWKTGMYRGSWTLAGVDDLVRACGSAITVTILSVFVHAIVSPETQPWTLFLIYGFVSTVFLAGSRASYVVLRNSHKRSRLEGIPVVIYGAGSRGVAAAREMFDGPSTRLRPIGFIDDNAEKLAKLIHGLPVLGGVDDIERIGASRSLGAILIAIPELSNDRMQRATKACDRLGIDLFRLQVNFERLVERSSDSVKPLAQAEESLSRECAMTVDRS